MSIILDTIKRKLSELREMNIVEIEQNLYRLRLKKSELVGLVAGSAEKGQIGFKIGAVTGDIFRLEVKRSAILSYVPIMELLLQHQQDGIEILGELLHILHIGSGLGSDLMEARAELFKLDACITILRENHPAGYDVIKELIKMMKPHFVFWGMVLRRFDSSVELLSDATEFNLRPIVERDYGRVLHYEFQEKPGNAGKYFGGIGVFYYERPNNTMKPHSVNFFVKGHQNFEMESNKTANSTKDPKPPDMKEILVYKILERLGYGPKTHYFINQTARHGLFIATQDCKFTRYPELKNKIFQTADEVQGLAAEPTLSDEVDLTVLDIITRSLVLRDLHAKNFGRVDIFPTEGSDAQEKHKWKLFDFLVITQVEKYDYHKQIGEDFARVQNRPDHRFMSSSSPVRSILDSEHLVTHRPEVANMAIRIIEGEFRRGEGDPEMSFTSAMAASHQEITKFIESEGLALGVDCEMASNDITNYYNATIINYCALKERIKLMK